MQTQSTVKMSIANLITLSRLPLLMLVVVLLYQTSPWPLFTALTLLPILYLMDWLDGYMARYKNEVTDLGSVLDIAMDRTVENVLWIVFAHQGKVPVFIPIVFIIRSFAIDGLRSYALSRHQSAFGMMHTRLGRFMVASRFMRGLYGLAKGGAFCSIALLAALNSLGWQLTPPLSWVYPLQVILVYLSLGLCLLRGFPVLWDIRKLIGTT